MKPSLCERMPGFCARDADCPDLHCRAHPLQQCDGGHEVHHEVSVRREPRPGEAVRVWPKRRPFFPATREAWGRVVMTGIGSAGLFFVFGAIGRSKGWW